MAGTRLATLFDLDGTLADTIGLILAGVRHAFAEHEGPRPTDADWVAGIGQPLRTQLAPFASGPEQVERLVWRYRAFQDAHHDALARPFEGAAEVLDGLRRRGHPVGVVTSKLGAIARRTLARTGLAPFVDALVTADSCPRHKPDPEPVLLALAELGASPSRAIFLGDSPHDVAAGNAAGVISAAALWGACSREQLEAAGPRHVLASLRELPELVERIDRDAPHPPRHLG